MQRLLTAKNDYYANLLRGTKAKACLMRSFELLLTGLAFQGLPTVLLNQKVTTENYIIL